MHPDLQSLGDPHFWATIGVAVIILEVLGHGVSRLFGWSWGKLWELVLRKLRERNVAYREKFEQRVARALADERELFFMGVAETRARTDAVLMMCFCLLGFIMALFLLGASEFATHLPAFMVKVMLIVATIALLDSASDYVRASVLASTIREVRRRMCGHAYD